MAINNKHKPKIHWDQRAFEKLRSSWSPERIAEDEKALSKIFNLAADCPLLAEALDWANTHGVKFFVDRTAVNVRGYYTPGTGVFGITQKAAKDPAKAVGTIVHEIRHAWQEYNDLAKPRTDNFSEYYIAQALKEADAKAIGLRAADQYQAALLKKKNKPVPAGLQASLADENGDLGEKFVQWFSSGKTHTTFYGDSSSKHYGQRYNLFPVDDTKPDKGLPKRNYEFKPKSVKVRSQSMSLDNIRDVLPLGVNFSGTKNYLAALQPDILPKKILRPSLANTFWDAANDEQRKLTSELRKAYLRKKLAPENKKPRHPWP